MPLIPRRRRTNTRHLPALAVAFGLACASAGHAGPRMLADSTTVESWKLDNGLRVTTRDIPGAPGVSITLAIGVGTELDPRGREGQMQVAAYTAFLSAAGQAPERKIDEMASIRPLGWNVEVGRRYTRLTEVARPAQVAGAVHELALRLRDVLVSDASLAAAAAEVRQQLARNYRDQIPVALYYQVREVAAPGGYDAAMRYASGKGIAGCKPAEIQQLIRTLYVPANAALCLAGDLSRSGVDPHRLLAAEFGTIPAGAPPPAAPPQPLVPAVRIVRRQELSDIATGVVGVFAPAIEDTVHPAFYMHSLLVGSWLSASWGRTPLSPSRFRYSLFDDPTMARIFTDVTASDADTGFIRENYREGLIAFSRQDINKDEFRQIHDNVRWLLGGEMSRAMRVKATQDAGVLLAISTAAAMRQLWKGDAFWADYLKRFDRVDRPAFRHWMDYFTAPGHQAQVMFLPP